jgi:hypothetical protein
LNFNPLESKAWKVSFSFNKASSVQGILVWVSTERGNLSLNDFQQYKKGQILQNFKCIADQNNSLISLTHGALQANTTYYFKVFSYVTFQNQFYYVKTPFEFEMTTAGAEIGAYYDDLDETSDQFLENLSRKLLAHDFVAYRDFESNMIVDYYQRDTLVNGQSKAYVVCDYSNHRAIY